MTASVSRLTTPGYLQDFTRDLYGGRCLRCGLDRPLDVAHLDDWLEVVRRTDGAPSEWTYWEFHQPANTILLCANCHRLLDDQSVTDVDRSLIEYLRDRHLQSDGAAENVRALLCRLLAGGYGRREIAGGFESDVNRLFPLLLWLQDAVKDSRVTRPHRFGVTGSLGPVTVDLATTSIDGGVIPRGLPIWNDTTRTFSQAEA